MPDVPERWPVDDAGDQPLIAALRALPLATPSPDPWPRLAARLRPAVRRGRPVRRWLVLATAAAVVVLLALPDRHLRHASDPNLDAPALQASQAAAPATDQLIAQSQWLERLLAAGILDAGAGDGDQLLLEHGLRERIGAIDAALAGSAPGPAGELWQARVGALTQLAEVRWAGRQASWSVHSSDPAASAAALQWTQ